jgi:hypothetical protein
MTTTRAQAPRYEGVVDLGRYPIREPASPAYLALVRACRDQLRDHGVARLAGFLTPAAARAWASDQTHTVYFQPPDDSAGPDHPRALLQHSAKKAGGGMILGNIEEEDAVAAARRSASRCRSTR